MAWVMFKQTSLRFGWISGRSGLMSSSRHWKGLWRFERASIGGFQTSKVRDGSGRFLQVFGRLHGDIFKKKTLSFRKSFFLRFPLTLLEGFSPSVSRFRWFRRVSSWRIVPMGWHPMTSPGPKKPLVSLGFPQQARRIWDGRSGLPNLGSEAKTNVYDDEFFPQQNDHSYWVTVVIVCV